MRSSTPKSERLAELARLVRVPPFLVVQRGAPMPELPFAPTTRLIVRGCAADEDGGLGSQAGRSMSLAPVSVAGVPDALERIFADARIAECIVQAFLAGPSGVVFSLAPDEALVEYAAAHGAVTSGRVRPFSAVLPSELPRYRRLQDDIARLHVAFGPCDLEFVGLEDPVFVQVRPITAPFSFDSELARVAMRLQEVEGTAWELNSYGVDLMERPEHDAALRALFLQRVSAVYAQLGGGRPSLPARPFLKLGRQTFIDRRVGAALRPGLRLSFTLGLRRAALIEQARRTLEHDPPATPGDVMDASLHLNLLTEVLGPGVPGLTARLLPLRERCRELLAHGLPAGEAPPDIACTRRLATPIERDDDALAWTALGWDGSRGLVVVPGDVQSGPFAIYTRDLAAVPAGCVLVTAELYPELAALLPRLKGIVSEGGAFGSHLAIVAREQRVPLVIQCVDAVESVRRTGRP